MNINQKATGSPFHEGEQRVQSQLGVDVDVEDWGRKIIRDHFPAQHRDFHTHLPFLVISARDAQGRPWATLLEGPDGFVTSPDNKSLVIDAKPSAGDGLSNSLKTGADVGILGIELATRRRNRVNGSLTDATANGLNFRVAQAFGNCPQYIRERAWHRISNNHPGQPKQSKGLTPDQQAWIKNADTFFIASGYRGDGENPSFGMDASHRGGDSGFVEVAHETRLHFPDYAGNNHFNTIGNLMLDARAGYLFVDFETGSLLQITGRTTIDWDSSEIQKFPGARRLISLDIDEVIELPSVLSLRWEADAQSVRTLKLIEKIKESPNVTSFVFESRDGGPLAAFEAGQHLPLELSIPGMNETVSRMYSLSSSPNDRRYRITVKREPKGLVSNYLHDHLEVGGYVSARPPAGDFVLPHGNRPLVLISAGVGVTPMVSMLHSVIAEEAGRPIWFIHGARDGAHHPLKHEVLHLAKETPNARTHVVYTQPDAHDLKGQDYDNQGRVTAALIGELVGDADADYMLCGPVPFMAGLHADLESAGVDPDQIHWESFGPIGQ